MQEPIQHFKNFSVGDYAFFTRKFSHEDFDMFSRISGDTNRLHQEGDATDNPETQTPSMAFSEHTPHRGDKSGFQCPIVPMHLTISPLSRIAGMIFPGEPSLYLSHKLEASAPVFYGEELTYSARILSINISHRVLRLSVIAFRRLEIVMSGTMTVQSRFSKWKANDPSAWRPAKGPRTALITGATGGIGSALARLLAKSGWNLLLHFQNSVQAAEELAKDCRLFGANVELKKGSLAVPDETHDLASWAGGEEFLELVVHTASPGVNSPLSQLTAVNFEALREITFRILPRLLSKQRGSIVFLSSKAIEFHPKTWEAYVAAKSMGTTFMAGIQKQYSPYGIRCFSVAPGYVRTKFSEGLIPKDASVMLPEEVAEAINQCLEQNTGTTSLCLVDHDGIRFGNFGFHPISARRGDKPETHAPSMAFSGYTPPRGDKPEKVERDQPESDFKTGRAGIFPPEDTPKNLENLIRSFLHLDPTDNLNSAGLGITPGWDSLRHIELLLEIERLFQINFSSNEIEETRLFSSIVSLLSKKLSNNFGNGPG